MTIQKRWYANVLLVVIAMVELGATPAAAQWSHDPYDNLNLTTNVMVGIAVPVRSFSDGQDGIISVWDDQSFSFALQAQRVGPEGYPLWGATGRTLVPGGIIYGTAGVAPDGNGGLFVAYSKVLTSNTLVYLQHFDGSGNPTWATDGVTMQQFVISGTRQYDPQVVADGAGGAVVSWRDGSDSTHEIFAQRFNFLGTRVWGSGVLAADSGTSIQDLTMAAGSVPGEICLAFAASSATTGWDIYGQRVSADGVALWSDWDYRLKFTSWGGDQLDPQIVSFNGDGVFATWVDDGGNVFYDAKDSSGRSDWGVGGQMCYGLYDDQTDPVLVAGQDGEAFMAFLDHDVDSSTGGRIVANRFVGSARGLWGANVGGTILEASPFRVVNLSALADGTGGLFLAWKEDYAYALHAERVNAYGQPSWPAGRGAFSYAPEWGTISLASDGADGFYAGFLGINPGDHNYVAMAQKIDFNGFLGDNGFQMIAVEDRPHDQGGELLVTWQASPLDNSLTGAIASYSIWVEDLGFHPAGKAGAAPADGQLPDAELATLLRMDEAAVAEMRTAGWTYAGQVPALFQSEYSAFCPSFGDSIAAGITFTGVRVVAHHEEPNTFWIGLALEGYSADNLAPGAPLNLTAANVDGTADLSWTASGSHDEDLATYRVYRGTEAGFVLDESSLVGSSLTLVFTDDSATGTVHYRVTAVDVHDNESAASGEVTVQLGMSPAGALPTVFSHRGNYPNPFNPMTTIAFDLPQTIRTRVTVYDAAGRLVQTLLDETLAAGQQTVRWNGTDLQGRSVSSGVYFSRVEAGELTAVRTMTLVR